MIVLPSDFVGKYAITQKYNSNDIETLIEENEEQIIYELLGVELGNDLLTNLGSLPANLQFIYDPFAVNYIPKCGLDTILVKSDGIKVMLLNILTGYYYLTQYGTATSEGKVKLKPEGGSLINDDYTNNYKLYNRGIYTYRAIQKYIKENEDTYPTFEGIDKKTAWLI